VIEAELTCEGDILKTAKIKRGFEERPLWKRLERLKPNEMIGWVDRFDSLCPIASEWALAQALESSMDLEIPKRTQFVRSLLNELNRLVWLATYLGQVTDTLGQRTITQQVLVLREKVFVIQEEITGGRILPQALTIGGCRRDFAMGDVQKVRQFLDGWRGQWKAWLELVSDDPLLEARLKNLMVVDASLVEKLGWWGIVGKASGVTYDSRKHRPHGAYPFIEFNIFSRQGGDAQARFHVALDEVGGTLSLLDQLLTKIPSSIDARVQAKPLQPGLFFGTAESAKGPVIAAVEVTGQEVVSSLRLFAAGQRVWPILDHLFQGMRTEDFQLAFASLGVGAEESEI